MANFQEDEMVQQALRRGVDLDKYGKELERELRQVPLSIIYCRFFLILNSFCIAYLFRRRKMESVVLYVENSEQVSDLHRKMQECDGMRWRSS